MLTRCRQRDPRVGVRLTNTNRLVRGVPHCGRAPGHPGYHWGEGWIWDESTSRGDTRMRQASLLHIG